MDTAHEDLGQRIDTCYGEAPESHFDKVYKNRKVSLEASSLNSLHRDLQRTLASASGTTAEDLKATISALEQMERRLGERETIARDFRKTTSYQLQGQLGTCYLFAAIDALQPQNRQLLARSAQELGMVPRKGIVGLTGDSRNTFTSEDIARWERFYHPDSTRRPPRAYILLEMAEELRRKRQAPEPGLFPMVEAGHSSKFWEQMLPSKYMVNDPVFEDFDEATCRDLNSPRRLVSFAFRMSAHPSIKMSHAYSLIEMGDSGVKLMDPAAGEVTIGKTAFLASGPLIHHVRTSALATPLGELCELLEGVQAPLHLKKKLFTDLITDKSLHEALLLDPRFTDTLAEDLTALMRTHGALLTELGVSTWPQIYGGKKTSPRPAPRPQPTPPRPYINRYEPESEGLSGEAKVGLILVGGILVAGAVLAGQQIIETSTDTTAEAVAKICGHAGTGKWKRVSGDDVFAVEADEMNAQVIKGPAGKNQRVLAEGRHLPPECFSGKAPRFVLAHDPRINDSVEINALVGGSVVASGRYQFTMSGDTVEALSREHISDTGRINSSKRVDWLVVEGEDSNDASMACRVTNSKVKMLCYADLKSTGLEVKRR